MASGGDPLAQLDQREIDLGLGDVVEVVGEGGRRDGGDDLDDFAVGIVGIADAPDLFVAQPAALQDDLAREPEEKGGWSRRLDLGAAQCV